MHPESEGRARHVVNEDASRIEYVDLDDPGEFNLDVDTGADPWRAPASPRPPKE